MAKSEGFERILAEKSTPEMTVFHFVKVKNLSINNYTPLEQLER